MIFRLSLRAIAISWQLEIIQRSVSTRRDPYLDSLLFNYHHSYYYGLAGYRVQIAIAYGYSAGKERTK